jgi:hypothetical protein
LEQEEKKKKSENFKLENLWMVNLLKVWALTLIKSMTEGEESSANGMV